MGTIGNEVFYSCGALANVSFATRTTDLSLGVSVFNACYSLPSISLPEKLTAIPATTFVGCTLLSSVSLPTTLTSIGDNAFRGCTSLASITVPAAVTSIGLTPFNNCSALTKLYMKSATAPTATNSTSTFISAGQTCTVYVPEDDITTYTSASDYAVAGKSSYNKTFWTANAAGIRYYHTGLTPSNQKYELNNTATKGFASLYLNFPFEVPAGLTAYYLKNNNNATSVALSPYPANANSKYVIPAKTGIVLIGTAGSYTLHETSETPAVISSNAFQGSLTNISGTDYTTLKGTSNIYTLNIGENGDYNGYVGFFLYTGTSLGAHKIYLQESSTSGSSSRLFSFDDGGTPTGLSEVLSPATDRSSSVFDLSGKRVSHPQKGTIYIINGAKQLF